MCEKPNLPKIPQCADKSMDIKCVIFPNGNVIFPLDKMDNEDVTEILALAANIKIKN